MADERTEQVWEADGCDYEKDGGAAFLKLLAQGWEPYAVAVMGSRQIIHVRRRLVPLAPPTTPEATKRGMG